MKHIFNDPRIKNAATPEKGATIMTACREKMVFTGEVEFNWDDPDLCEKCRSIAWDSGVGVNHFAFVPDLAKLDVGKRYRLKKQDILGLRYSLMYDEGQYIHVRILEGPDHAGRYIATTRDENGKHIGPGGGWTGTSELKITADRVEIIPKH